MYIKLGVQFDYYINTVTPKIFRINFVIEAR
jgi:hypothetical protein